MSGHLLALTVGPVQEFIAAARRTRDLWFGSYLLSEISKAAAKAVRANGGDLIFPAPRDTAELRPDSALNVANVIVAELKAGDPAAIAKEAKTAAQNRWRAFAHDVFRRHAGLIDNDIWTDQVDDVIEVYAAWHSYAAESYAMDRWRLMRLLDARKLCRDFQPAKGRAGVPKSSLDGLRESALRPPQQRDAQPRAGLRLREGEQLDVVGLVKRAWSPTEGPVRYPSVARVAADPWLQRMSQDDLEALVAKCQALGPDVLHEINTAKDTGHAHYSTFPYEGTAVYRSRHGDICKDTGSQPSDLAQLQGELDRLTKTYGEPSPYLAVLVADGDRMGQALSKLESPEQHRRFSQALARFAGQSRQIVDARRGVLVYAGGDDVLAFVPVPHALACARDLHEAFQDGLADWTEQTGTLLTLSVGLAIAHFMEPLEDLRNAGHAAEQHAKRPRPGDGKQVDRDGLAVHLTKRGGAPLAIRRNWSDNPDTKLAQLAKVIGDRGIPRQLAYDMHKVAAVYDSWPAATVRPAMQQDIRMVMQRKQPQGASGMQVLMGRIEQLDGPAALRGLADELLVAHAIAAVGPSDVPVGAAS